MALTKCLHFFRNDLMTKQAKRNHHTHQLYHGKDTSAVPSIQLASWSKEVRIAQTGPDGGLTQLDLHKEEVEQDGFFGVSEWNLLDNNISGLSVSFYENCGSKGSDVTQADRSGAHGYPIADVHGAIVRDDNVILAIADGSGWGKKPRLAARCAVRGAVDFIVKNTDEFNKDPSSRALSKILFEALESCQENIITHRATLTTLSIGVVCKTIKDEWGLFVLSLGDSPVFVYSPSSEMLYEASLGNHSENGDRNVKLSGGALGPAIGTLPDLENLSIAYTKLQKDDFVLLMTDGVSDNFSSNILGSVPLEKKLKYRSHTSLVESLTHTDQCHLNPCCHSNEMPKPKRCCDNLHNLQWALCQHHAELQHNMSSHTISSNLLNIVSELTEEKRLLYTKCALEGTDVRTKAKEDFEFAELCKKTSGKLDHASLLVYKVPD